MLDVPILFLIFNRPDVTEVVFAEIKKQRPQRLYVAADGPRLNREGEISKCNETRNVVMKNIDWPCEVRTLFRDTNLGCGKAVSEAITWFFNQEEMGMILEDDCLPTSSFFSFCSSLLKYYKDNEQIFVIPGDNFQKSKVPDSSYYFSAYGHIWGWASWRRAWKYYNFNLNEFDDHKFKSDLRHYFSTQRERTYWFNVYSKMKNHEIDTWDYQWTFAQWSMRALSIIPNVNLVSNIGFNNEGATHTSADTRGLSNLRRFEMANIIHATKIIQNKKADLFVFDNAYQKNYSGKGIGALLLNPVYNFIKKLFFVKGN